MRTYKNFIGGEWVDAKSGRTLTNINPADTREDVAKYPWSDQADAQGNSQAKRQNRTERPLWVIRKKVRAGQESQRPVGDH